MDRTGGVEQDGRTFTWDASLKGTKKKKPPVLEAPLRWAADLFASVRCDVT